MGSYNLVGIVLAIWMAVALNEAKNTGKGPNGPIQNQKILGNDRADQKMVEGKKQNVPEMIDNDNQDIDLMKLIKSPIDDDTGKAMPVAIPQKIISGGGVPMSQPGRNWARKMNEEQYRQHQAYLNPKPHELNKKVMHNRNSINDNRHDKKGMKIPRHLP